MGSHSSAKLARLSVLISSMLAAIDVCTGVYYLPGVAPYGYQQFEAVPLFVSKLTSTKTQMPYEYYTLPFCRPRIHKESENLGEVISGDRIENSVYKLQMKVPVACQVVCLKHIKKEDMERFAAAIDEDYRVHWMVDNLPVGMRSSSTPDGFVRGFPVGALDTVKEGSKPRHVLFNHVRIIISYNEDTSEDSKKGFSGARIVGFRVEPYSIHHKWSGEFNPETTILDNCNAQVPPKNDPETYQSVDEEGDVLFTYDVHWEQSDVEWSHRWDTYLTAKIDNSVHWFSITNSSMIVLFLTVMIAMILIRTLRRDIAKYNDQASIEEAKEESGWKLVHGDVFRPPKAYPMLFAVFVGTGAQLFLMSLATLTFALLGFLSPANRGSLITAFILLFVFMGAFAGYFSSRTYKMFRGVEWKQATLLTAFLYPSTMFAIFFVLNLALWSEGSSGAIPFSTFFTLLFLWFGVSVPLVFVGSFFGYKKEIIEHPVRTNQIPRQIPTQPWYMHVALMVAFGGILPFGAVSVELFFIMSAMWLHQIYYIFGFLFLVMLILIATCAEMTILLCYFQLVNEDYRWWWRAFLSSGSCAGYMLVYSIWYHMTKLSLDGYVSVLLYYGYMTLISITFFLITGTIGYFACFWFNTKIYGSIKVDWGASSRVRLEVGLKDLYPWVNNCKLKTAIAGLAF